MRKYIPDVNLPQVVLILLLLYVAITIIVKELPLILFALSGLLVYKYRAGIKKKLKKYLETTI